MRTRFPLLLASLAASLAAALLAVPRASRPADAPAPAAVDPAHPHRTHGAHPSSRSPDETREYIELLERPDRAAWQKPDEVVAALGLRPGGVAADVGVGPGYFALRMARAVGPTGRVHAIDADHIEKGSQVTAWGMFAKQTGGGEFPRCKIDRRLSDGEEVTLGNKKLLVIHTPGHTPGSVSFLLETGGKKLLFSGDTVLYDYRLGWQENPYADNRQYLVSFEKLDHFIFNGQRMLWDVLLPGHGAISMDRAYLDVKKGRELVAASLAAGEPILSVPYTTEYYRARMYGRPATPAQR